MRLGADRSADDAALRALAMALGDLRSTFEPGRLLAGMPHELRWTELGETLDRAYTAAVAAGFSPGDVLGLLRALDLMTTRAARPTRLGAVHAYVARLRARARTAMARLLVGGTGAAAAPDPLSYGAGMFDPLPERLPCIGGPFDGEGVGGWRHARDTCEVFRPFVPRPMRAGRPGLRTQAAWASDMAQGRPVAGVHLGSYRLDFAAGEAIWVPA